MASMRGINIRPFNRALNYATTKISIHNNESASPGLREIAGKVKSVTLKVEVVIAPPVSQKQENGVWPLVCIFKNLIPDSIGIMKEV